MSRFPTGTATKAFADLTAMLVMALLLAGCASIPRESVDLSNELGKKISESRRAHTALLNSYFGQKKSELDEFIEGEYVASLVGRVQKGLRDAGRPDTLTVSQIGDLLKVVMAERDAKQADLEKTRIMLQQKIDEHYASMTQANSGITGLLASAVSVRDATARIEGAVKSATGGAIDLEAIDRKINEKLKVVGDAAKKTTTIYDDAKALVGN